jgi:N-glycosylase/DNA lyase
MTELAFDGVDSFDLTQIFECGQTFRWRREADGGYAGAAGLRHAKVSFTRGASASDGCVRIRVADGAGEDERAFWENYFDLGRDYKRLQRELAESGDVMARAVEYGCGIRILNQDPWEMLISFIISQNNNIPRIRGCVERLCDTFGPEIAGYDGSRRRGFPGVERLAALSAADLDPCGLGYRAEYILCAARRALEAGGAAWLESLRGAEFEAAEQELLEIHGIGPKVAACILLFGLGKAEAFPVDVWVRRAMRRFYDLDVKPNAVARRIAAERFGSCAGIAQQYLFYYIKNEQS